MSRDMSKAAYQAALDKHGIKPTGFMGYMTVYRSEHGSSSVHPGNAGPKRRAQLAYLLREKDRAEREHKEAIAAKRARQGGKA